MEQLWTRHASAPLESPHTLLCGEGGMSKTISCVRLWEELLEESENAPLPIFIPLNEYNAATEEERKSQNYLYRFIAREYLDDARLTAELVDALNQLFRAP
ncbi:MAG: hypothetical protein IPJ00_17570 [Saprospirales bacterium]|nr:hypothetical protein [Saprospirales bacterium]